MIDQLLKDNSLTIKEFAAVAVSSGPGSYTGLRVGVSLAKGLCFGAGIPLLSVGTLETLCRQAIEEGLLPEGCRHIVPMVDARRMEVYTAVFSADGVAQSETRPQVIEANSFAEILDEGPVLFVGDGAVKCAPVLTHPNAHFAEAWPKAGSMLVPACKAWNEKRFEDIAYFEPSYLKDFIATVSRKKLF
jgi:tRNA threonylcarbamoyladenosine biosynthesis protein TsaB